MSLGSLDFKIGQSVRHPDLGEGIVIDIEASAFIRVYFRSYGEHIVPRTTLLELRTWEQQIAASVRSGTPDGVETLSLAIEAIELPLLGSGVFLTSAKVDLLPHQIVLVHRIANSSPRRYLIADEVGLGKTVEVALILRELLSRGELTRSLIIVPAGLVENWRRELNEVFHLDFEVFGSEGDVTDRKTNTFVKHNFLIASIDTLKRQERIKKLLEAPKWDLVIIDEAHHISAYKTGKRIRRTENFKLAQTLRDHCRDLLLLSATPHQGDHFRFWMLVSLLDSTVFTDEQDMVDNRHRLNALVVRRTKADACTPDGNPLFARRVVHTEAFSLNDWDRKFYDALLEYLRDGYNLAEQQGQKGRPLGFIMAVFQKIAASSFAAVRSTLLRRLLTLTLLYAIESDERLDVDSREDALREARELIRVIYQIDEDAVGQAQVDRIMADSKMRLLQQRKLADTVFTGEEVFNYSELDSAIIEDQISEMAVIELPRERGRIRDLLRLFPSQQETKVSILIKALRLLWQVNPDEKIVIFATYLGSVDTIRATIEEAFPEKGVEILKGGDHRAKTAAIRRFSSSSGAKILISTAAGREGINLQFARVLFNYDLPWNPMDLEQRIGRIHRYGQAATAQIYNLVATDTIEGAIYLLLEEKLQNIAVALGKIDEIGQVTEDFRAQVLGQLGSRLSYDHLYQEALRDPLLRRTKQELEIAMTNANMARSVVFELFQSLERFNLEDYVKVDDQGQGMHRLISFVRRAAHRDGGHLEELSNGIYALNLPNHNREIFTTLRDAAIQSEDVHLIGLEDPILQRWFEKYKALPAEDRAVRLTANQHHSSGIITFWHVTVHSTRGQQRQLIVRIGVNVNGERSSKLERSSSELHDLFASQEVGMSQNTIEYLIRQAGGEILQRHLEYGGMLTHEGYFSKQLIGLVEITES